MKGVVYDPLLGALRTKDDTGGGGSGGTCANSPQLLCLGGRTGTTNDPLLSTDGDGTLTGSGVLTAGLILNANPGAGPSVEGIDLLASTTQIESLTAESSYGIRLWPNPLSVGGLTALYGVNIADGVSWSLTSDMGAFVAFASGPRFGNTTGAPRVISNLFLFNDDTIVGGPDPITIPFAAVVGAYASLGGTLTLGEYDAIDFNPSVSATTATLRGMNFHPSIGGAVTDLIAFDIGPGLTATNKISLRSPDADMALLHTGPVRVGDVSNAAFLKLADAAGHDTILTTQTQAGDITYALPAVSVVGQLTNDPPGTLSWTSGSTSTPSFMGMLGLDGEEGPEGMPIPGSPGAAGATGATGSPGAQGIPGFGLDGADGDDGLLIRGDQGIPGPTGAQGPPGFPIIEDPLDGDMGPPGLTGAQGLQGIMGPQGFDGDVGDDGLMIQGNQGSPGATGLQGIPGIGLDGEEGPEGLMIAGNQGAPGATGQQGIPGIGLDGEEGPEGLMIQGNQGSPGATGSQGIPGIGLDGTDGDDGLMIQGNQGSPGATGPQGPIGAVWLDDAPMIEPDVPISIALPRMRSLDWFNLVTDPTGTGAWVFGTAPTFTTSITDPLVYGGTTTGSTLDLRASSAANFTGAITLARGAGDIGSNTYAAVTLLADGLTITPSSGVAQAVTGVQFSATVTQAAAPNVLGGPALQFFVGNFTHQNSGTVAVLVPDSVFYSHPTIQNTTATNVTDAVYRGLDSGPTFQVTSSGTLTASEATDVYAPCQVSASTTITTRRGLRFFDATGAGAVTNQIAVDVPALAKGGTLNAALRSAVAAGSTNYALKLDGTAQSLFGGKITTYNNVATQGQGLPYTVKIVDLTAQTAATAGTALWTPSAAGAYRVSVMLTLTTAGTTSVLGGAGGVKINYKTGDGATAKNQQVPFWAPGSTTATVISSSTNTVGDTLIGAVVIYTDTTAVTYDVGYTAGTPTVGAYSIHMRVESL